MPTYRIENRPSNSQTRRMAIVTAETEELAKSKLLRRFPDATDLKTIKDTRLVNPMLTVCIIR